MPKNISWRKLVQKFQALGFMGPRAGGPHLYMVKGDQKVHIPNPHQGDISVGLVVRILRRAGIAHNDWDNA